MRILVTGGTGYIGSHTCVQLLERGDDVIIIDNLCNSEASVVDSLEKITGRRPVFYEADIRDREALDRIFSAYDPEVVIHFAGLKAVGESVSKPLEYYENNISGTLTLLEVMRAHDCRKMVFSSSATVYGTPASVPIREEFPTGGTTNPYGTTKLFLERILTDLTVSDPRWSVALLRYFNPIGAHQSGLIGDDPTGIPNNLMPYVTRVAKGTLPVLSVYGNDYPTHDGTGVRDYIHVEDLAAGHVAVLPCMKTPGVHIYNLGTGVGYSVLDIINAFERSTGVKIAYRITERRPGDIAECWSDPSRAAKELGWKAERTLEDMCRSAWNFEKSKA
ncbi:MAG: UDP-glucose 4-epimerase GalE [Oscillospiraceae bacterium]|nr:UDP-glucose 4-epimerase GalE [Oscillospiraceae bacterium]